MNVELIHIGLVCRSREDAERFFGDLLGLPLTRTSDLPAELAPRLFGVEEGCEILFYESQGLVFEIFVTGWSEPGDRRISHCCIEVDDRPGLLDRARAMGYEVRDGPRRDYRVYFIVDGNGNLFEIRQRRVTTG
jgi:catechol 2,3-dioxygenase-like lactoylglutathione lyase family enzyme